MRIHIAIAIFIVSTVSAVAAADSRLQYWTQLNGGKDWQPPPAGVVSNARTAIAIARAIAVQANGAAIADEQTWQAKMRATLQKGVWEVTEPVPPNTLGGSCFFCISQVDARILGIHCSQ